MSRAALLFFVLISSLFSFIMLQTEDCENYDENGSCGGECPEGMVKYNPPCDEETMSQKTCRKQLTRSIGMLCDFSRCDCPEPKVWDEAAKRCVLAEECSDQSNVID